MIRGQQGAEVPLKRLKEALATELTLKGWADKAGLSPQYVTDVRDGRRAAGPAMLLALGLVRVVTYAPIDGGRS